jgi:SAM-dependent methyltransferase
MPTGAALGTDRGSDGLSIADGSQAWSETDIITRQGNADLRILSIEHREVHLRLTRVFPGAWLPRMPDEYTDATYGDRIAEAYDEWYEASFAEDTAAAVSFLNTLAMDGPALELGIGTGRLALPLAEAGIDVHGIDASAAMVAKLQSKPGGDRIPITVGSFADFSLETRFRLVYVAFNTFFGLLTQDEQISCFAAVARHLTPDGVFAMQAFVPDVTRFDAHNQRVAADSVGIDEVALETSTHDPFTQRTDSAHLMIRNGGIRMYPVRIRYAYVSELDLMARLAGLRLRDRWAGWDREAYPSRRWTHVSVWEKATS